MKRPIVAALIIGLIVAGLIIGLEIAGLLARPDEALSHLFPETTKRLMPAVGYGLVVIIAVSVAFSLVASTESSTLTARAFRAICRCSMHSRQWAARSGMMTALLKCTDPLGCGA